MCDYPISITNNENKIVLVSIDTDKFKNQIIQNFIKNCPPIERYATGEHKTPEERREKSNSKIKSLGIACYENLRTREDSSNVTIKNLDDICKRAIASLFSTQVSCDIQKNNYEESVEFFSNALKDFGVTDYLNEKEKKLFNGNYSNQDVIDIEWEYEAYWAIIWALGLIENDISTASNICNCKKAISVVSKAKDYDDFKSKCYIRSIEEILDMLDLYFRYDWATAQNRINPDVQIGDLNPSVVIERRRGLEWILSNVKDWYDIQLHT